MLTGRECAALAAISLLAAVPTDMQPSGPVYGGAAAAAQVATLNELQRLDQRVANVGWRLVSRNTQLCPVLASGLGIGLHSLGQYTPQVRLAARAAFGLPDALPGVLTVAAGSPAERAGVRPNDILLSVNGMALGTEGEALVDQAPGAASYDAVNRSLKVLEALIPAKPATLLLRRNGAPVIITVEPTDVCYSRIDFVPGPELNASANGSTVQVSGRLVQWVKSDDELALVIGHEVAHNVLRHEEQVNSSQGEGMLSRLGFGSRRQRTQELEADRFGTLMAARAGFNYKIAPDFWSRLTRQSGLGTILATTHPTAIRRRDRLKAVVRAIEITGPDKADLSALP